MRRFILVSVLILLTFTSLFGQIRFGYIDSEKIRAEYREFQAAQAQFDKEVSEWQAEAESLKAEVMKIQEDYEKQALLLSDEKKREFEMRLRDKTQEYESFLAEIFSDSGKAQRKNVELTRPLLEKINEVLYELAEDEKLDVIFDIAGGGVAYARPGLDLTEKLLNRLNR